MLIEITYNVTDVFMSTTETPVYVEISFEQPGGSAAVWGSITGTLSNQTDLQNALNLKVPYTGATTNVNLGEYELKAGQLTLDTSPTGTAAVGTIRWNDTTGTSETTLKGGNVILKNGVDLVARVVNKVTPNTTLTKAAYQAVRVSGAQGQRLAVAFAQANNDANSADTIGIVIETIPTNQEGFIMTVGQLEGINTTGSLQGETWADGDVLYLSPTTAGALTNIKPTAVTGHIVVIGYVEYAHANNGKIYVKVMNGWELDELHNVSIVTPTNNQGLFYNSSNSLWENKSIATVLGYTPVPTTRNITINGVTYDLSADRTYTISTGISGSGASGQVTYWTGASAVSGSNNFFWDNANGRLGIGTNVPSDKLHVVGTTLITDTLSAGTETFTNKLNGKFGTFGIQSFSVNNGFVCANMFYNSTANSWQRITTGTGYGLQFFNGQLLLHGVATGTGTFTENIKFKFDYEGAFVIGNNLSTTQGTYTGASALFTKTGNLILNSSTLDGGQRLQVYGDTLLRGSGNTSATTALTVQNSDSSALLKVDNSGSIYIGNAGSRTPYIAPYSDATTQSLTGRAIGFVSTVGPNAAVPAFIFTATSLTATSGTGRFVEISPTYSPTSGTGTLALLAIQSTINQTGGANGITRGLYVNPTLTSAADFRAIETTAGNVLFGSNFFWDNTNGRLGIGTNAPAVKLDVNGQIIATGTSGKVGTIGANTYGISVQNNASASWIEILNNGGVGKGVFFGITNDRTVNAFELWNYQAGPIDFYTGGTASTGTIRARIGNNGNISIGTSSDLGVRLGVVGDTLLRGSGATSATTALTVQNSSSTNLLLLNNAGNLGLGVTPSAWATTNLVKAIQLNSGSLWNFQSSRLYLAQNLFFNGTDNIYYSTGEASSYEQSTGRHIWYTAASGTGGATLTLNQRMTLDINGLLGIGQNTPTALADIGASTTTRASLRIRSGTAPTTPNDGDIWFDGTDIKMRIGGVTKTFTLI